MNDNPDTIDNILDDMLNEGHTGPADSLEWVQAKMKFYADRIKAAAKREANSIERLVRDAIIDYQEMYAHAPNDDAERELIDRAERGNAWLVAHGYEPERLSWSKEESPCL